MGYIFTDHISNEVMTTGCRGLKVKVMCQANAVGLISIEGIFSSLSITSLLALLAYSFQCFDTVGWATGIASSLYKYVVK